MKIVVIGGTGHIGSYLVPRLIREGHQVTVVTRGDHSPYVENEAWKLVDLVRIDRESTEKTGDFGRIIAAMHADVVIDLICFTEESARQLVEALRGNISQLLVCGTIWINGFSESVPFTEEQMRNPVGAYGINKAKMTEFLFLESRRNRFPVTVIHPGHIVGCGWIPLNPQANFSLEVWKTIKAGGLLSLPNHGMETVHHVHADDVASVFIGAMNNWSVSLGESFNALSPTATTLRGYAHAAYRWFGHEPKLEFLPWDTFTTLVSKEDAWFTWDHISRSPCGSIEKARRLLGYTPRYTALQAIYEAIQCLQKNGRL